MGCEKLLLPFEGGLGLLSDAFLFGFSVLSNQYGLDVVLQVGERGWNCTPCLGCVMWAGVGLVSWVL